MKTKLSCLGLAALALASCSSDELIEVNDGPAINFSVVTNKATRAEVKKDNLTKFKVWAYKTTGKSKTFLSNIECTRSGNDWKLNGGTMFWPEETLNFYMLASSELAEGTTTTIAPSMSAESQTVAYTAGAGDVDMVYAVCKNKTKEAHIAKPVNVNFRHALSQIAFQVANINPNLKITVTGIKVVGVNNSGTYSLTDAADTYPNASGDKGEGAWAVTNNGEDARKAVSYTAYTNETGIVLEGVSDKPAGAGSSLFLVPQTLPTWTVQNDNDGTFSVTGGTARIEVTCTIEQLVGDGSYTVIWNGPVTISLQGGTGNKWLEGKKYVYTLTFGDGAGYDNTNPDDPKPAIVPIKAKVDVEEFTPGGTINGEVVPPAAN